MGHRGRNPRSRASAGDWESVYFGIAPPEQVLRKERQLCKEAFEVLGLALSSLEDESFFDVELVGVEPAPDASRLAVVVRAPEGIDPAELLGKLERISGYLRRELAAALHRKRIPSVTFRLAPGGEESFALRFDRGSHAVRRRRSNVSSRVFRWFQEYGPSH
ncbi:MAG: ribosome-binding factor A [Polyangiaceae bacterium]|nr:ribosome-binding factor A [Polyangiaceae bacterium]